MNKRIITNFRHWWQETRTSFWFVPALIVAGAVGLAAGLIALDANVDFHFENRWPLVFGAGAAGARGLLTAVASSMITVAGVVFSITIVALSLTSSQYTSRVLRNFMGDRSNQVVLGVFVGIFAYCLVVLRTIRGGDEGAFVPSLAVLGGLILAFVGIGYLIFFIHHISMSIQASSIIAAAAEETIAALDSLFPSDFGDDVDDDSDSNWAAVQRELTWITIAARKTGYIESVDEDAILKLARKHGIVVRMERGIGEFVEENAPLVSTTGLSTLHDQVESELSGSFVISRYRTVQQDVGFGIRQIVDIALKALSPGVNDNTTAVMCVDYLGAILARLAPRGMATDFRLEEGELRVIARSPSFESLFAEAFDQIRQNAEGNVAVLTRQLQSLESIARQTTSRRRKESVRQQADIILDVATRTIPLTYDVAVVKAAAASLFQQLDMSSERSSCSTAGGNLPSP